MVTFDQQNAPSRFMRLLASADPVKIAANAGDIFRFAAKSQERMFRVEAILKLGRYRFDAARSADQIAAPRYFAGFGSGFRTPRPCRRPGRRGN